MANDDVSNFYAASDIVASTRNGAPPGFATTRANHLSEWGAMGGNLVMRLNEMYLLRNHGDYLKACAWGVITLQENTAEIAKDPSDGEIAMRGCKKIDPDQELELVQVVQHLLEKKRNL